jgi:hypothetical protein
MLELRVAMAMVLVIYKHLDTILAINDSDLHVLLL